MHTALASGTILVEAASSGTTLWFSVLAEVAVVAALGLLVTVRDSRRARDAAPGTVLVRGGAVTLDTLARLGATSDPSRHRGPLRRVVRTHSGTVAFTPEELSWRPDAYSRRHGGRGVVIPLEYVRRAEAIPRVFGMGSLLMVEFEDGSQVQFVTLGRAGGLQATLQRLGLQRGAPR